MLNQRPRRIDGALVLDAEDLIGKFRLNYNQIISKYEALGRQIEYPESRTKQIRARVNAYFSSVRQLEI